MRFHVYWSRLTAKWLVIGSSESPVATLRSYDDRNVALCMARLLNDSDNATTLALSELGNRLAEAS